MAKLTSVIFRSALTLLSENTAKLTLGALFTVTAVIPASCTTVKGAVLLVAVSLAGKALAVAMAALAATTGTWGAGGVCPLLPPPPPQPTMATATRQVIPHLIIKRFIFSPSLFATRLTG